MSVFERAYPETPNERDLELINQYSRKKLKADEVYVFRVVLCDNEVDRDLERFDIPALKKLAELFVGKTGISDHSMRSAEQTSRIFKTEVVTDSGKATSCGEPYTCVAAFAYMPRTVSNAALIEEIDAGIKKEASVGCAVGKTICSVCGKDFKSGGCVHKKGAGYNGKLCHAILGEPTDAYEWSFVAVPAQPAAGVTKSFIEKTEVMKSMEEILKAIGDVGTELVLTSEEKAKLLEHLTSLGSLAETGREYLGQLRKSTVKNGLIAMPELSGEGLGKICERLSARELHELNAAFEKKAASVLPPAPQLTARKRAENENIEFKF